MTIVGRAKMALFQEIFLLTIFIVVTTATFSGQSSGQSDYGWNVATAHESTSASNSQGGFFSGKLNRKKNKFQPFTSLFGSKNQRSGQKEEKKSVQPQVWKIHNYKGIELKPMTFEDLPKVGIHIENIRPIHNDHGYKVEEEHHEGGWEFNTADNWDWKLPQAEWIPVEVEHEIKTPTVATGGKGFQGLLSNKRNRKLRKINRLQGLTNRGKSESSSKVVSQPLKVPHESPVVHFTASYHSPLEEHKVTFTEPIPYPIPFHSEAKSSYAKDNEPHYSEQYTNFRRHESQLRDSYGAPVNSDYGGAESNQVEIIVPPPTGVHVGRTAEEVQPEGDYIADIAVQSTKPIVRDFKAYRKEKLAKEKAKTSETVQL